MSMAVFRVVILECTASKEKEGRKVDLYCMDQIEREGETRKSVRGRPVLVIELAS